MPGGVNASVLYTEHLVFSSDSVFRAKCQRSVYRDIKRETVVRVW